MVRPNQIISSDIKNGKLTFIMFARDESTVKRRVALLNFPGKFIMNLGNSSYVDQVVDNVELVSEGMVNRYAVTLNLNRL